MELCGLLCHTCLGMFVHSQQGWSPDNLRPQTALDELAQIAQDPKRFITGRIDREAKGPAIVLPDGSTRRSLAR